MFVIELLYKVPLTEIDAHMSSHVAFLKRHYAAGHFLVSGRKIPRDGGIILAVGGAAARSRRSSRRIPSSRGGLADVRIVEFRDSQRAADIDRRLARFRA